MPGLGRVGAVYFDLYGTLLDLGPLDGWCEAIAPGRGADFARAWRTEQLRLTWLRTIMDAWVDFEQVTDAAVHATASRFGVDARVAGRTLAGTFDRLTVRPEAPPVIAGLGAAGLRVGVLSNGSRSMIDRALAGSPLAGVFDDVLSVDAVRRYKPDPAVYDLAVRASGRTPADIGFVTANDWDAAGGAAFGFQVAWLRRPAPAAAGAASPAFEPAAAKPPALGGADPIVATWGAVAMFATGSSPD